MREKHVGSDNCPTCKAMDAMKREEEMFLVRWLQEALDRGVALRERDPFRFSTDDVLDAHEELRTTDRIPTEWMDARFD